MNDTTNGTIKLYKKIASVMATVDSVEKKGHNSFHNYDYATEADVMAALKAALLENGLIVLPTMDQNSVTTVGEDTSLTNVSICFRIIDIETGESETVRMGGQGTDKGDKGIYKAITGANKYFLLKTFMIPTDDDPEKDDKRTSGNTGKVAEKKAAAVKANEEAMREAVDEANENVPLCETHDAEMKPRNGGAFYSHARELENGSWDYCSGNGWKSERI